MCVCIYDATVNNDSTRFYTLGDQQTKIVQSNRYGENVFFVSLLFFLSICSLFHEGIQTNQ
jgi:hypothetical protein